MKREFRHGASASPSDAGAYSSREIERFNQEHDQRYGWSWLHPGIYTRMDVGHCKAPPNFDKSLPTETLNQIVWDWHAQLSNSFNSGV
jgi:hypothetical protein